MTRALGVIRTDISGSRIMRDQRAVEAYAARTALEIVRTLVVPATEGAGIFAVLDAARVHRVDAIVVPARVHLQKYERGITEQWALHAVESDEVWNRGHRWPSPLHSAANDMSPW